MGTICDLPAILKKQSGIIFGICNGFSSQIAKAFDIFDLGFPDYARKKIVKLVP